ncbi:MAG: FAD-dependent oxidoreductase, partial [Bacteroidota bacterium]
AGFACFGSVSEIAADLDRYGYDAVLSQVQMRRQGLEDLAAIGSSIDFMRYGGTEVFRDEETFESAQARIAEVNEMMGADIFFEAEQRLTSRLYQRCIHNLIEGQLHPSKYHRLLQREALRSGVELLTGVNVVEITDGRRCYEVTTDHGSFRSPLLLNTTNALASRLDPELAVVAVRNQVMMTDPMSNLQLRGTYHLDGGYIYFRNVGDRVLIGGGRHLHKSEQSHLLELNPDNQNYLEQLLRDVILPGHSFTISKRWSGILSGGDHRLPIVKEQRPGYYVAVRLAGMGVAIGSLIGRNAASLLLSGSLNATR